MNLSFYRSISDLRKVTGVVIPNYFSEKVSFDEAKKLLGITLQDSELFLDLSNVVIVTDGDEKSLKAAEELREEKFRGIELLGSQKNMGKGFAVLKGMKFLLGKTSLRYICVRDNDGDHFVNDLPSFCRAALAIRESEGTDMVLVLGRRHSLHNPMGYVRGELEGIEDRVLCDALRFCLARKGRWLDLRYSLYGEVPDIGSGYKLYTRPLAEKLLSAWGKNLECLTPEEYWRYLPEVAPFSESVILGAAFGEVNRITYNVQPVTSFGSLKYTNFYGSALTWMFLRLEIPLDLCALMLDIHMARSELWTHPEGKKILMEVRKTVLDRVAGFREEECDQLLNRPPGEVRFL